MRPAVFENSEIISAGLELQAEGRNITGFAIRERIGGGRADRLMEVWKEYKATESAVSAEPVAELPVELEEEMRKVSSALTDRLFQIAREVNDKAVRAAERRVSEITRAAVEQATQAERELSDASLTVENLEDELNNVRTQYLASQERIDALFNNEQAMKVQLAQLQERLAGTENQLEAATQQLNVLREQHTGELKELKAEHAQKEAVLNRRIEDTAAKMKKAAEQQLSDAAAAHEKQLNALREQHIGDLEKLEERRSEKEAILNGLIDDAAARMTAAAAEHKADEQALLKRLQDAEEKSAKALEKASERYEKQQEENARLREDKSLLAGEVNTLSSQNEQLLKLVGSAGKSGPKTKNDKS